MTQPLLRICSLETTLTSCRSVLPFIANPDLPRRYLEGAPLNEPDRSTFFGGDHRGYTDYPYLTSSVEAAVVLLRQDSCGPQILNQPAESFRCLSRAG